ncbi:MAG: AraC family transcriptional regulator [Candidatus Adiutrix sp.]|jgi:AraC-like DNA-binding protein|nr:AraC family transcriptional regulator [Candidatus Adiutrix sp.]
MKLLHKNKEALMSPGMRVKIPSVGLTASDLAWRSPLFRLAAGVDGAQPVAHPALPGLGLELLPPYVSNRSVRAPFPADPEAPLVFSLQLSGAGLTVLKKKQPIQVQHGKNELIFYNYSLVDVEIQLDPGENCQVNLLVRPEALPDWLGGESFSLDAGLVERINNSGLIAPLRLIALGQSLLKPPVAASFTQAYRSGAALVFLALAADALYMSDNATTHLHLNRKDLVQLAGVKRHIEEHLTEPLRLQDLSRMFCLNEFKLKTGFKQIYRMSVAAYATYCRVNFAHSRFLQGESNVSQCAWDMGYTNVSHFIATFRKHFGLTPGEFIRRMR